jgi:AcrR family transcriptional regulator
MVDVCRSARVPEGSFQHVTGQTFAEFIAELQADGYTGPVVEIDKIRVAPALRRESIIDAALRVADRAGWQSITRDAVATEASVSPALVSHLFGTVDLLRDAVMAAAAERGVLNIVAEGLSIGHPVALRAGAEVRAAAATYVAEAGGVR